MRDRKTPGHATLVEVVSTDDRLLFCCSAACAAELLTKQHASAKHADSRQRRQAIRLHPSDKVLVLDRDQHVLEPCHAARARTLVREQKATWLNRAPPVIQIRSVSPDRTQTAAKAQTNP